MDNFMDKLAQKLNAQEIIKANSEAEAAQMKKLQLQVAEYERILQEMRKLNYKNVELSDKIDTLVGENASKIRELQEDELKILMSLRDLTQEQTRNQEQKLAWEKERQNQEEGQEKTKLELEQMEELFKRTEDFSHKENVKVYRNVQAIVVEEIKKQTELLREENKQLHSKLNLVSILAVLSFLAAIVGIILQIVTALKVF